MNLDHDLRADQPAELWQRNRIGIAGESVTKIAVWVPISAEVYADTLPTWQERAIVPRRADPPALPRFDLFPRLSRLASKVRRARP